MDAYVRRRGLGLVLLSSGALALYSLSSLGLAVMQMPASFQLLLLPSLLGPLLGGVGLLFPHPPRVSRVACGAFLLTLTWMVVAPAMRLPTLLSLGSYATFCNALASMLASLFWTFQVARIVFEENPQLDFKGMRMTMGIALACSFLFSLRQAWDVTSGWAFQIQATGSAFYGFPGWKVWDALMALLSLGLVVLPAALARSLLPLLSLGWMIGGGLLVTFPDAAGLSRLLLLAIALLPALVAFWLWREERD